MIDRKDLRKTGDCTWTLSRRGGMRVPVRIYAAERMLDDILADNALEQAVNVARLPGIVGASMVMPDIHWGYGFPIGGVAAFDVDEGVISPGGVGYDINCGVRLMAAGIDRQDVAPHIRSLVGALFRAVPTGTGSKGAVTVSGKQLRRVLREGARWSVGEGLGTTGDIERIEENGRMADADPDRVGGRAMERGKGQLGTLGSGNHFLEIGYVADVFDADTADRFGLRKDQVTVTIHCGSRGFGHQVCDDAIAVMNAAAGKYGIELPDRQLCCVPIDSDEGRAYLGAMRCAVNYAFANRQAIAGTVRRVFENVLGRAAGLETVYEVAHNIAKIETHEVDGTSRRLCVHRKGATRAFGPGRPEVPAACRDAGQPVMIPGDMGRCSYVLAGTETAMRETFGSTCHGAGRLMSRGKARKSSKGRDIIGELNARGIEVMCRSRRTLGEEVSEAYKDVADVVDACEGAGISRKVARLRPLGCIKG